MTYHIGADILAGADMRAEHDYLLRYTVEAVTEFEAIAKAAEMLRRGVVFVGVHECERAFEPYWNVTLRVSEAA